MIGAHDEVVVRDPDSGAPVPDGEVGELTFRGPSVIRSYLADEHSAAAFTAILNLRGRKANSGWKVLH